MVSNINKDREKKGQVKVGDLKLNKETVRDLSDAEAKKVKGGLVPPQSACARGCLSWGKNYCPN